MTTTTEKHPHSPEELEAEVHSLEDELSSIRQELAARKARSGGIQLAAFFAVLLGIASLLAVAFKLSDNQSSADNAAVAMHKQMRGNTSGAMGGNMSSSAMGMSGATGATGAAGAAAGIVPVSAAGNVKLTIKADAKPGSDGLKHDAFLPGTNLSVKAGQTVHVTVYNYDDMPHSFTSPDLASGAAIPASAMQMQGTPQDLKTMPGPGLGVDANVPGAQGGKPGKATFSFKAPSTPGKYVWYCKLPCDDWAMAHYGYMKGFVTVS